MDPVVVVFAALCLIISGGGAVAAFLLRTPNKIERATLEPYECGEIPLDDVRFPWKVGFLKYLLIFLLFDIELILMLPWFWSDGLSSGRGALGVALFLVTLLWGLAWPIRRGVLGWQKQGTGN